MARDAGGSTLRTLKYIFRSKEVVDALAQKNIYTVNDLVKCPFGTLIRMPILLRNWDGVIEAAQYFRYTQIYKPKEEDTSGTQEEAV